MFSDEFVARYREMVKDYEEMKVRLERYVPSLFMRHINSITTKFSILPRCWQGALGETPRKLDPDSKEHCDLYHAVRNRLIDDFHLNIKIPESAGIGYSM